MTVAQLSRKELNDLWRKMQNAEFKTIQQADEAFEILNQDAAIWPAIGIVNSGALVGAHFKAVEAIQKG